MTDGWNHNQKEFYDKSVASFDKEGSFYLCHRDNRNHLKKIRIIANALGLSSNKLVLEIGVGTGIHASWVLKQESLSLVGIELSRGMINTADYRLRQSRIDTYHLIQGIGENLCFRDNTFDAVYCSGTLHHVESPSVVVSEMARVTKPGGNIGIMEPNWVFPVNTLAGLAQKHERNMLVMRKCNLKTWADSAGLKDVKVENFLYTPPVPLRLASFYDHIDSFCQKAPLLRNFSIMLFLWGRKPS